MNNVNFKYQTQKRLTEGVEICYNAVKTTLGPNGKNVIIKRAYDAPHVTKDGVSVVKEISSEDGLINMGIEMTKESAKKSVAESGDGTTTTTVLTYHILTNLQLFQKKFYKERYDFLNKPNLVKSFLNLVAPNSNNKLLPDQVSVRKMLKGVTQIQPLIEQALDNLSQPVRDVEDIYNVALISSNQDKSISNLIKEAYENIGNNGVVIASESRTTEDSLEFVSGLELERGLEIAEFATSADRNSAEYKNAVFFLHEGNLTDYNILLRPLEACVMSSTPIIIFADDFDPLVLDFLIRNKITSGLKVMTIKTPGMGGQRVEQLKDLAAVSGSRTLEEAFKLNPETLRLEDLGSVESIKITRSKTTIVGKDSQKEAISERVAMLDYELSQNPSDYIRERIEKRKALLEGKLCFINLYSDTAPELKERMDRMDDAIRAVKSAIEEGVIPGAGMSLRSIGKNILSDLDSEYKGKTHLMSDELVGIYSYATALTNVSEDILDNGDLSLSLLNNIDLPKVYSDPQSSDLIKGVNANGEVVNLIAHGIIDPTKVTKCALKNSTSIASLIFNTECSIY